MQEIPECLHRRYKALDELVKELNDSGSAADANSNDDPSVKLLCDFWNILKEDPDLNLSQAVQERMCVNTKNSGVFGPPQFSCFMASCSKKNEVKKQETINKIKNICCKPGIESSENTKCRAMKSSTPSTHSGDLPLNKVLCNLKEAASFEKKCQRKVNELLEAQKQLQEQIQCLEQKEKEGMQLLKQADCMWSCMEGTYKKKIAESLERQKELLEQLKEVEESNKKWRKNKKDLDFQMDNIDKCHQEITEKINQKTSDVKCIDIEIDNFKKHIETNKKDLESTKKSFNTKKNASDAKIANITKEVTKLEKILQDELKYQKTKEQEGGKYVKEAREDLQKLCKVLLQKKLENEDLNAERDSLLLEIDLLNQTCDQCKDKCKNKQDTIDDEMRAIDKEIAKFKLKCIRCHECTDTIDVRKFCIDCPRCIDQRDCLYEGDHCSHDYSMDCVCTTVKQKFLDNVFDNMYTTLERQVKVGPGKAVAEAVLNCLRKSRNGKLNGETRKILQDFILTTVKKNLNLTIVGGAVKTRCEMDSETYKQLMLCLKQVKVVKPEKTDQGTECMKEPCTRWGGRSECNCPKGPKECVCTKKAPQPLNEPRTCPPEVQEKEDSGETILCPYKETTACGPDCARHELPSSVAGEVASWRPNPCQGPTCQFKNMRAAQCVLGSEVLSSFSSPRIHQTQGACKCGQSSTASCVCNNDITCRPRDRIIEEVIGKYTDVTPIEKVSYTMINIKQLKADKITICNDGTCENISKVEVNEGNQRIIEKFTIAPHTDDPNLNEKPVKEIKKKIKHCLNAVTNESRNYRGEILHLDETALKYDNSFLPKKSSKNVNINACEPIKKITSNDLITSDKLKFIKSNKLDSRIKYIKEGSIETCQEYSHSSAKSDIYKVNIKGLEEPLFILKRTISGNFEVVLDKEFKRYNKKAIKEHKGDDIIQYAKLVKTSSDQYIINFEEDNKNESKNENALLMKSESGNIKVLVDKYKIDSKNLVTSKSVMTSKTVGQLLKTYSSPYYSTEINRKKIRKARFVNMKSNSELNFYSKDKVTNKNKNLLKTEPSEVKDFICKAIGTSCNAQRHDDSCDKNKCVCKNICYKSKQWFWKNSDSNNFNMMNEYNDGGNKQPCTSNCDCCSIADKYCKDHFCCTDFNYPHLAKNIASESNKILYREYPSGVMLKENSTPVHWDSLDYLPQQLPIFLRKFEYNM